jgi:transposase-like protein
MESLPWEDDVTAAKAFFRKALKRHGEPRVITLDGFEATHAALRRMGMNNEFSYRWYGAVQISKLFLSEQRCRTRSPESKKQREPDARIQASSTPDGSWPA